jgi:hypothetical protein
MADRGPKMGPGPGSPAPHVHPTIGVVRGSATTGGRCMFFFYFNKLGCLGSIIVSVAISAVLILALRSCHG